MLGRKVGWPESEYEENTGGRHWHRGHSASGQVISQGLCVIAGMTVFKLEFHCEINSCNIIP